MGLQCLWRGNKFTKNRKINEEIQMKVFKIPPSLALSACLSFINSGCENNPDLFACPSGKAPVSTNAFVSICKETAGSPSEKWIENIKWIVTPQHPKPS